MAPRRKPKVVGSPGQALPETHGQRDEGHDDDRESQVELHDMSTFDKDREVNSQAVPDHVSLVKSMVETQMQTLTDKLDDTRVRLERIELLLFQASFSDFEKFDRFISDVLKGKADEQPRDIEKVPERRPLYVKKPEEQPREAKMIEEICSETTAEQCGSLTTNDAEESAEVCSISTNDPFEMLSGMSLDTPARERSPFRVYPSRPPEFPRPSGNSDVSIGQIGNLEDLAPLLSVGALLESTSFTNVKLRSLDGARYRTAGPLIKVVNIQVPDVTFTDAAPQPTLDPNGRPIFGQLVLGDEFFCIVGHSKRGGIQIAYSELIAGERA